MKYFFTIICFVLGMSKITAQQEYRPALQAAIDSLSQLAQYHHLATWMDLPNNCGPNLERGRKFVLQGNTLSLATQAELIELLVHENPRIRQVSFVLLMQDETLDNRIETIKSAFSYNPPIEAGIGCIIDRNPIRYSFYLHCMVEAGELKDNEINTFDQLLLEKYPEDTQVMMAVVNRIPDEKQKAELLRMLIRKGYSRPVEPLAQMRHKEDYPLLGDHLRIMDRQARRALLQEVDADFVPYVGRILDMDLVRPVFGLYPDLFRFLRRIGNSEAQAIIEREIAKLQAEDRSMGSAISKALDEDTTKIWDREIMEVWRLNGYISMPNLQRAIHEQPQLAKQIALQHLREMDRYSYYYFQGHQLRRIVAFLGAQDNVDLEMLLQNAFEIGSQNVRAGIWNLMSEDSRTAAFPTLVEDYKAMQNYQQIIVFLRELPGLNPHQKKEIAAATFAFDEATLPQRARQSIASQLKKKRIFNDQDMEQFLKQ